MSYGQARMRRGPSAKAPQRPERWPAFTTRPELDHADPHGDAPIIINVLDRLENRLRLREPRDEDVPRRDWLPSAAIAASPHAARRHKKFTRRRPIEKGTAARRLDQFYTRGKFAARYLKKLARRYDLKDCLLVEPSAGNGAFSGRMPINTVAIDIDPKRHGILKADYLAIELRCERPIIIVGNPPFGRNACLAVDFFNHAAGQADVIAMILPRSFLKASIENRLNPTFHLVHCEDVPPNAFELDGECRDVAAVFQIWERRGVARKLRLEEISHPDFEFTEPLLADFVIRRVGVNAGEIGHDRTVHEDSHYFIRGNVEHVMRQLDLTGAARKATSTPSLARSEVVALYREHVEGHVRQRRRRPTLAPSLRRRR